MLDLVPEIQAEYDRWSAEINGADPYISQSTVGITEVLKAHFLIANFFYQLGEGMGGIGPRDLQLLHSALLRQHVTFGAKRKWEANLEVAATLFFGLIKDHPFHDANKRTAFLTLLYHLDKLGRCPEVSQTELEDFAVEVADDQLAKYARYEDFKKRRVGDPEVRFIAHYLKKNTRSIDKRYYAVTYQQLQTILRKWGYDLQNPKGNKIDVVRIEERRTIFGLGPKEKVGVNVCQVGFPGWTRQVGKGAMSTIRKATKLTADRGVDSAAFFGNAEYIDCLIAEYQDPLRRLANR